MPGSKSAANNVVLVHGGFVDGSGWEGVYKALKKDRFSVTVVQNPTVSLSDDVKDPPPGAAVPPILPPQDGYLFLDIAKFPASFAADVDPGKAEFMADSQVPWGLDALNGTISQPAWKSKPSWYLVATDDRMIPPPAQRLMAKRAGATVVEVQGSHSVYVSKPNEVAGLIAKAAKGV